MAKSRNRGGAKAHRKRVQKRNQKIGIEQKKMKKAFESFYKMTSSELEKSFERYSALTNSDVENTVSNEEPISSEKETENTSPETESK